MQQSRADSSPGRGGPGTETIVIDPIRDGHQPAVEPAG